MIIKEIYVKTILSKSKVADYTINPYIGCEHGCSYCYARYIKRFTGHEEEWGEFIDVKVNASNLLKNEIRRKRMGRVWISGLCDPYQPIEKKHQVTKECLKILLDNDWPVTIQTKSPFVLRDLDLLKSSIKVDVGFTITTANDKVRQLFEHQAPSTKEKINALKKLHSAGIKTYVMIAPLLPGAEGLVEKINGNVDYILIDKMNYHYADWLYKKHGLEYAVKNEFFFKEQMKLSNSLEKAGIPYQTLF